MRLIPENFGANWHLGLALLNTGDPQDAISPLKKNQSKASPKDQAPT
jgi:hypothetical protein